MDQEYETDHLQLAAFLLANKQVLLGTAASDRRKRNGEVLIKFRFQESAAIGVLTSEFWNNTFIGVQDFLSAQQTLRAIVSSKGKR